jgi:hypothetical protein
MIGPRLSKTGEQIAITIEIQNISQNSRGTDSFGSAADGADWYRVIHCPNSTDAVNGFSDL